MRHEIMIRNDYGYGLGVFKSEEQKAITTRVLSFLYMAVSFRLSSDTRRGI